LTSLNVAEAMPETGGAIVSWETGSERSLVGFNILRSRSPEGRGDRVNPIWIPALGDPDNPASYQFLDSTAEKGNHYYYRIEGVTLEGLRSLSDPVALTLSPRIVSTGN
jgi:hypothetical protein